jgi:hypothetical protein
MEAYHIFGQDLVLSASGDLLLVSDTTETQQRILRRLLTNPGDYIWQLSYGAGLPSKVGRKVQGAALAALIRSQIFQEASVSPVPPPQITLTAAPSGQVNCVIIYTDQTTQMPTALTFTVGA